MSWRTCICSMRIPDHYLLAVASEARQTASRLLTNPNSGQTANWRSPSAHGLRWRKRDPTASSPEEQGAPPEAPAWSVPKTRAPSFLEQRAIKPGQPAPEPADETAPEEPRLSETPSTRRSTPKVNAAGAGRETTDAPGIPAFVQCPGSSVFPRQVRDGPSEKHEEARASSRSRTGRLGSGCPSDLGRGNVADRVAGCRKERRGARART